MSPRTVRRRLHDAVFGAALDAAQAELFSEAARTLTGASPAAATTLTTLLDPPTPAPVRLATARTVLELVARLREQAVEERLARIEAVLATRARQ